MVDYLIKKQSLTLLCLSDIIIVLERITEKSDRMIFRAPQYYYNFRCIADKCRDNCCIGWEIDIDNDTADYYRSVSGEFGRRLEGSILNDTFILTEDDRCPFLNHRGLCDIYTTLGEEHLCQICTDHPRFFEWFGDIKEGGIGMCCEEAARLILSGEMILTESVVPDEDCESCDDFLFSLLSDAREAILAMLREKTLEVAVCDMLAFAENLQKTIDSGVYEFPEIKNRIVPEFPDISEIIGFYSELEPIDCDWIPFINRCLDKYESYVPLAEHETMLKRIAVYFIYRYFMKGVFDGEILSRVKLAVLSTWFIGFIWRCENASDDKAAVLAKNYSKEIEYCLENIGSLADASYTMPCFSSHNIAGLFYK